MPRERERERERESPFSLSVTQSLTEVSLFVSSLYTKLYLIVNKKGVQFFACFIASLFRIGNKLQCTFFTTRLVRAMNLIISNISNKALADILYICLQDKYPGLSKKGRQAVVNLLYFYDCSQEFFVSNSTLETLFSCKMRQAQNITHELAQYSLITKDQKSFDTGIRTNGNSLHISINLSNISNIKFKETEFLATYIKTETLHKKDLLFKAIFKNVHDLDNIITIKSYEICYDDETSNFLKKLNAGDVISFTPSINKPTIKGIKHPLNLKKHTKAETEDNMTFFATFDRIEEKDIKWSGLKREARFKDIHNINGNIRQKYTWTDIEPNTENTEAIAKMDEGQDVVFKATVIRGDKGFYFKNIHNIIPREEFYNNNFIENTND